MKVFLSWSGPTSKQIAVALREWLPNVIQLVEPFMSSEDIEKGARWRSSIAKELETTKAGIVCVTPDNTESPWLNFEAGALSKTVEKQEMVCTYLHKIKPSQLKAPLSEFQTTEANREDTLRLVSTLNRATAKPLSDARLQAAFDNWWGDLEAKLAAILDLKPIALDPSRPTEEVLAEVLGLARSHARTLDDVTNMLAQISFQSRQTGNTIATGFVGGGPPIKFYNPVITYKEALDALNLPAGWTISSPGMQPETPTKEAGDTAPHDSEPAPRDKE